MEKSKSKKLSLEERIEKLRPFFADRTENLIATADALIAQGFGQRYNETQLEYLTRINYCQERKIPFGFWGFFYVVDGKVSKYVEYKQIEFEKQFPYYHIETVVSTPKKCIIKGYPTPQSNPIRVEYTMEKAIQLRYCKIRADGTYVNVHWEFNPQKMLNKCCKGDFYDLASGGTSFEGFEEMPEKEAMDEIPDPGDEK